MTESEKTTNSQVVLSVRIKNDKEGPQTGDVILDGSAVNEWFKGGTYEEGDVVIYESQFYQSLELQEDTQEFDRTKWKQIGIPDIIVPEFKTNTYYSEGQVVVYEEKLYRAKEDFTSSAEFYPEDWESISGETYKFTSEDRSVIITLNDETVDFSVSSYVDNIRLALEALIENKVDKEDGKGLSTNDFTTTEKLKLQSLAGIFQIGDNLTLDDNGRLDAGFSVSFDASLDKTSTNGVQNRAITIAIEDLQDETTTLSDRITTNATNISTNTANIEQNTSDITQLQQDLAAETALINSKVDKVDGKELSSNDYTDEDQIKLNSLQKIYNIGDRLTLDASTNTLSANDQSIELLQETGQSTTKGMSQKGITDAIADAISGGIGVLAPVATSGSYNDLIDTPTIDTTLSTSSENAVQNKAIKNALDEKADINDLSQVAFSGDYSDLSGTPTIDSALSDTSENAVQNKTIKTALDNKANTSDLATVATSGSYDDLSDVPAGTIRIFKDDDSTLVSSFTLNQKTSTRATLPLTNIRTYTEGKAYAIDDVIVLDGSIYRCVAAIASAPATMNESDWEQIGGKDTAVITLSSITSDGTWTSNKDYTYLVNNYRSEPIVLINNDSILYVRLISNSSTFYIITQQSTDVNTLRRITLNSDGTTTVSTINNSLSGTLTIEDAEGEPLGTFNGSANTTITLPESFDILTNAEIDSIWENA